MKIFLPLLFTCAFGTVTFSQVLFSEDFDGMPGPTAGGAGTYVFPSGWLLRNVDNQTPNPSVSYVNEAWERREDFGIDVTDSVMFSTSWYSTPAQSDDWAWTPVILLTANNVLTWNARSYDPAYLESYEVRIMGQSSTPGGPTGSTGILGNQVTNSTVLFSTAGENSSWTSHSIDLSSYAGQNVWIGFRDNSSDKFLLVVDDVVVNTLLQHDADLTSVQIQEYSSAPLSITPHFPLSGTVLNDGVNTITGLTLTADVYNSANTLVHTETSAPVSLNAGASNTFTLSDFVPVAADTFNIVYHSAIIETDNDITNDTLITQVIVSDSVYSRDLAPVNGSLGIGAGNGGYLGQQFTVNTADTLTSITAYYTRGYTGRRCAAVVWDMAGGYPNQIIASTDTILYPDDSARVYTLNMTSLTVLNPGEYVLTAIEFDSTLSLGLASDLFTLNKTWVDWPTNPISPWGNNEDYGTGFQKSYILRGNFADVCHNAYVSTDTTICYGATYTVGTHTYAVSGIYHDTLPNGYCDSIITTNLVVLDQVMTTVDTTICFGETYTIGSSVYSSSGAYTDILPGATCDSTVITNLTVLDQVMTTVDTTICFGATYTVGGNTYSSPGTYTDVLPGAMCDSTVTTHLAVAPQILPQISVSSNMTMFMCTPVSGASYQWINCTSHAPISGATSSNYTTALTEQVAVIVTVGACSDTSACISNTGLGLEDHTITMLNVMPNPAKNLITITSTVHGNGLVMNAVGQQVSKVKLNESGETTLNVETYARGVYFLTAEGSAERVKFVLE